MIDAADAPAWVTRMVVRVEDALREIQTLATDLSAEQIRLARARMTQARGRRSEHDNSPTQDPTPLTDRLLPRSAKRRLRRWRRNLRRHP